MEYPITGKATPMVKEDRVLNEDVEKIGQIVKKRHYLTKSRRNFTNLLPHIFLHII